MMGLSRADEYGTGAIVCEHIARNRCPVLSAFRTESVVPEDSGWQFFCGTAAEENYTNAQIWLLGEVFDFEPSLEQFAQLPAGIQLRREDTQDEWRMARLESES